MEILWNCILSSTNKKKYAKVTPRPSSTEIPHAWQQ